ncbi:MAG TPA: hypothetical protein VH255_08345, partial [Verrucomicrobiae bacterium]|nr:hypothetical protein [Verrucomicrobiae bacterium]
GVVPGIDLAYSAYIWNTKHLNIGWEIGFDWLPIGVSANQSQSGFVDETTTIFSTGGIVVPTAPYQGGSSGTGPLLPTTPTSSTETTSSPASITGTQGLDLNLYVFRLGPTFNVNLGKSFSITAGIGPALGVVDGELQFNENIVTSVSSTSNKGHISATQLVYGGYVNFTALYHLPSDAGHADIYISTQYMPLNTATFKGAGREGQLELSGQASVSIGFNWPF